MQDTCDDIVKPQSMVIPMLRIIGDGATLHPHTLTHGMCCVSGSVLTIASVFNTLTTERFVILTPLGLPLLVHGSNSDNGC